MNDTKLDSPEAIKAFLGGTDKLDFQVSKATRYSFLAGTLKGNFYQRQRRHFTKTQSKAVQIGERRKPNPQGQPGFIRIDIVHQGDQDKQKGVYHINAVDEVTQFEVGRKKPILIVA